MLPDEDTKYLAVAIVEYARVANGITEWCRLRPIYLEQDGKWVSISLYELEAKFPSEGRVYWHRPEGAREGTAWVVTCVPNPRPDRGTEKKRDHLIVDAGHAMPDFLTLKTAADEVSLRQKLAGGTLGLHACSLGPTYIRVPPKLAQCIGPIAFSQARGADSLHHVLPLAGQAFVEMLETPEDGLQQLNHNNRDFLTLRPHVSLGETAGWFNVQSDEQLLDGLLKRLRKLDRNVAESLGVTKAVYSKYIGVLQAGNVIGSHDQFEAARERAVSLLMGTLDAQTAPIQQIGDALLGWPSVAKEIEKKIAEKIDGAAQDMHDAAVQRESAALAAAQAAEVALAEVSGRLSGMNRSLKSEQLKLDKVRVEAERIESEFTAALLRAAKAFTAAPGEHLADSLISHVIASSLFSAGGERFVDIGQKLTLPSPKVRLHAISEVALSVRIHASANGLDPDVLVAAAAMLLAGRAVIVTGPAAEAAALGLSRALAGGNQINFPVPSSIFSVDDMLGLRSDGAHNSNDETVRLGDLLRSDSPRPFLATLTNIDRAPFEVTFADLAMRYVPKLATAQQSEDAGFGGLISTMMSGPSTFLIPRSLRCHTGVIYATWVDVEPDLDQAPRTAVQPPITGIEESAVAPDVRSGLADFGISPREAKRELQFFAAAFGDRADGALWWSLVRLPGLLIPQDVESRLERSGQNKATLGSPRIQRIMQAVSAVTQSE